MKRIALLFISSLVLSSCGGDLDLAENYFEYQLELPDDFPLCEFETGGLGSYGLEDPCEIQHASDVPIVFSASKISDEVKVGIDFQRFYDMESDDDHCIYKVIEDESVEYEMAWYRWILSEYDCLGKGENFFLALYLPDDEIHYLQGLAYHLDLAIDLSEQLIRFHE